MENQFNHSVLDVEVSWYRNYFAKEVAGTVSLLTWLQSDKLKDSVKQIRQSADKNWIDLEKAKLPAITPSGIFHGRNDDSLEKHSGFICLDIDFKDNQHISNYWQLHNQLINIKQVAYCGLSVSAKGYFVLIPIASPEKHQAHFLALLDVFENLGIRLDRKCGNLSRFRGYSWDPNAWFNHTAPAFEGLHIPPTQKPPQFQNHRHFISDDAEIVENLVQKIEARCIDITGDYNYWFAIACNLASSFGENGRSFFHRISKFHPKYSPKEIDYKFNEALKKVVGDRPNLGVLMNSIKSFGISQ